MGFQLRTASAKYAHSSINGGDGLEGHALRRLGSRKRLRRAREDLTKLQIDRMIAQAHCSGPAIELIPLVIDHGLR